MAPKYKIIALPDGTEAEFPIDMPDDEIAAFLLAADLQPGDTVLPVDWTEGAVHAMLIAKALPASPFIYDYYFNKRLH